MINIRESLAAVDRGHHLSEYRGRQVLKLQSDLLRYEAVIEHTRPQVIIETGTHEGGSALWFLDRPGVEMVVTVDLKVRRYLNRQPGLSCVLGDSIDPSVFGAVRILSGHGTLRTMVVLDSLHTVKHVEAEIDLYGPLVTPGCALVVEDGLYDKAGPERLEREGMSELIDGGPLAAIRSRLVGRSGWRRASPELLDVGSPWTQNVDGWWIRR